LVEIAKLNAAGHEAGWEGSGEESLFEYLYNSGGSRCVSGAGGGACVGERVTTMKARPYDITARWQVRARPSVKFHFPNVTTRQQLLEFFPPSLPCLISSFEKSLF